jgi:hypothetical protein
VVDSSAPSARARTAARKFLSGVDYEITSLAARQTGEDGARFVAVAQPAEEKVHRDRN